MLHRRVHWLTVLMVALMMALAACGGAAEEGADGAADADTGEAPATDGETAATGDNTCMGIAFEEGASIVFSGWGDETEQQVYRDSIDRFAEECPGINVDYQPVPTDFQTQVTAAFAGGEGPDVIYVDDQLMTSLGRAGQLVPLDDYMEQAGVSRDEFIQPVLEVFTFNDQTYALPKDWGTLGLVYLPAAFEEAGVEPPTADWTWDDLRAAAETIAENTDYGAFCQGADWARFAPWAFSHGASFVSDDGASATLTDEGIITAATQVAEMNENGSLVEAGDVGASWCGEAIGKELVAMTLEGGWMVNFMRNDYPDVTWEAVPVPAGPAGEADVIFTNGIAVNANSEYPGASAAFTLFVTGRDNQAAIAATGFAYPAREDQLELIENPIDQAISEGGTYELTRVSYWGPNTGRVNDAVSKALERIYLGEQDVEASFEQAQVDAQTALDEAGQ